MSDWERRELCPDGGCVGVIGSDGICSVCGKRGTRPIEATAADSGGAKRGEATDFDEDDEYYYEDEDGDSEDDDEEDDESDDDDEGDADADEDGVASVSAAMGTGAGEGDWGKRTLCPDGACVGVIGDNGRCKVCGKSAGPG